MKVGIVPFLVRQGFLLFALLLIISGCKTIDTQVISNEDSANRQALASMADFLATPIQEGDIIAIKYVGRFSDGTIFSRSPKGKALKIKVGESKLLPGFEKALIGMQLNEEKSFLVEANRAYGKYNPELKRNVEKSKIPATLTPSIGLVLSVSDATGKKMNGVIVAMDDSSVTLDFNHPLAGKDLYFKVKVIAIKKK